ncbi:TRAP transporter small permease [Thalassospira sp. MA62]|nr:TRAP transporter small permease [Thalassospira sp. MA62]
MPHRNSPVYRGLDRICRVLTAFAMLMLTLMAVLVVGQVVMRNLFDLGLPWADELSRIANVALVFFAIPALMLHNRHIAIDLLFSVLGRRGKATLRVTNYVLIAGFGAIFAFGLYKFLSRAGKFSTPSIGMPNYAVYAPVVVAIALLIAIAIYRLITRTDAQSDDAEEIDAEIASLIAQDAQDKSSTKSGGPHP